MTIKRMTKDERLLRQVDTPKLVKFLELWTGMSKDERMAFTASHSNALPGMAAIRKELNRRHVESGMEILQAILNGEQR